MCAGDCSRPLHQPKAGPPPPLAGEHGGGARVKLGDDGVEGNGLVELTSSFPRRRESLFYCVT